jgi:predicted GH43/DUF377 family glycosyl hydrolase
LRDKEFTCARFGTTSLGGRCKTCSAFQAKTTATGQLKPTRVIRYDHHNLYPKAPGVRFNPSIIESGDGYLFCWRHGWAGCQVWACRLNKEFKPVGEAKELGLTQQGANKGREDPRWFRFRGKLHLWYIGVTSGKRGTFTNVCYARVNEQTLEVEKRFLPHYPMRQFWEKNIAFFDFNGMLFASYTVCPHRVWRVDGNQVLSYESKWSHKWSGGEMRGGASPVRVGDEYFHFFHGLMMQANGRRLYNVGLVVYEARPPFKVKRYTPDPLDVADPKTCPPGQYADVLFTCGAVKVGDQWALSLGVHDRWSEIRFYDAAEVERRLVAV